MRGKVTGIHPGPVITRFELEPASSPPRSGRGGAILVAALVVGRSIRAVGERVGLVGLEVVITIVLLGGVSIFGGSGTVYFAPPGYHLLVEADRSLALSVDPPVNYSRPSIDVLLESCAAP